MNFWLSGPLGEEEGGKGMCILAGLFADKSAPTGTASGLLASRSHRVVFLLWGRGGLPYWQASQSGSSIAQAFGTGAGPAG
ncbi:hypothetical protein AO354_20390, partial [Pseudomonas syringae pv. syringae]